MLDRRPAGVAQAEQLGPLVEGFSRGVVDRRAQEIKLRAETQSYKSVWPPLTTRPTAGKDVAAGRHAAGKEMRLDVIHVDERNVEARGQASWPRSVPTKSEPTSPGRLVTATAASWSSRTPAIAKRFVDCRNDPADVGPRGNLGNDAAERAVQFVLRADDVGKDGQPTIDHGGGGFIAARFDRQKQAAARLVTPRLPTANRPLAVIDVSRLPARVRRHRAAFCRISRLAGTFAAGALRLFSRASTFGPRHCSASTACCARPPGPC